MCLLESGQGGWHGILEISCFITGCLPGGLQPPSCSLGVLLIKETRQDGWKVESDSRAATGAHKNTHSVVASHSIPQAPVVVCDARGRDCCSVHATAAASCRLRVACSLAGSRRQPLQPRVTRESDCLTTEADRTGGHGTKRQAVRQAQVSSLRLHSSNATSVGETRAHALQ